MKTFANKGKAAKNEWENDDFDFFQFYAVYILTD